MSFSCHLGALQQLLGHVDRAGQHDGRLRTDIGESLDARARLQAHRLAGLLRAQQHGCRTIDDAGRIAGMVHMVDLFEFRIALHGHRVEAAHLAGDDEGGVERGQRLHVGRRAHMLVMIEDESGRSRPSPARPIS